MKPVLLNQRLQQYQSDGLYRTRLLLDGPSDLAVYDQQQRYLSFCSNDYLGLANHPQVVAAFKQGADEFGVGSGASQLICGHRRIHQQLEQEFAEFVGFPRGLLFANGYMANLGVLTALTSAEDRIYQDHDNHASLLDAGKMAAAQSRRYLHANMQSLESYLTKPHQAQRFIVSDGVFSMSGEVAPLAALADLAQRYQAGLIIDDAHGVGVLGHQGRGSLDELGIDRADVIAAVYPLGKAFGGYGAIVVGSDAVIESLIQFARSYSYTTALPPALAGAALASLFIIQQESWRQQKLLEWIQFFRQKALQLQLPLGQSQTAIQTILIDDNTRALSIADQLQQHGFLLRAMRPPTVAKEMLRITLRVDHTEQHITELLELLRKLLNESLDPEVKSRDEEVVESAIVSGAYESE